MPTSLNEQSAPGANSKGDKSGIIASSHPTVIIDSKVKGYSEINCGFGGGNTKFKSHQLLQGKTGMMVLLSFAATSVVPMQAIADSSSDLAASRLTSRKLTSVS